MYFAICMVERGKHISKKKKRILRPFSKEEQSNLKNQLFQIIFSMAMTCVEEELMHYKRENRIQLHGVLSSSFHQGLQFGNQAKDEIFTFFSPSRK
jgi:hypothetical protein